MAPECSWPAPNFGNHLFFEPSRLLGLLEARVPFCGLVAQQIASRCRRPMAAARVGWCTCMGGRVSEARNTVSIHFHLKGEKCKSAVSPTHLFTTLAEMRTSKRDLTGHPWALWGSGFSQGSFIQGSFANGDAAMPELTLSSSPDF